MFGIVITHATDIEVWLIIIITDLRNTKAVHSCTDYINIIQLVNHQANTTNTITNRIISVLIN